MENSLGQQHQQVNEEEIGILYDKVFQCFSKRKTKILDKYKELVSGFPETNSDGSAGAKSDSQDKLSLSISRAGYTKVMHILHIVEVNEEGGWDLSPLHLAAVTGDTEVVDVFLKAGVDVNAEDRFKQTALHLGAYQGSKDVVENLLKAGANVNAEDDYKQTPLHYSAEKGYKKRVETLLQTGAFIDTVHLTANEEEKEEGKVYLKETQPQFHNQRHLSDHKSSKEVVELLLKAGANVNATEFIKQTPLHLSAARGHTEMVEVLLKAGANVSATDCFKKTSLHISAQQKHDDISELLLHAGASVNERDIGGKSVLDYMDDKQRIRFGFGPRKLFKLRNWMYSITKSKKHVDSLTSSKTKTEHTETISATFTDLDAGRYGEIHSLPCLDRGTIPNQDSSKVKGHNDTSRDSSTLLSSGHQIKSSAVTSLGPGPQLRRSTVTSLGPGPQLRRSTVTSLGPGPQLRRSTVTSLGPGPQLRRSTVTSLGSGPQLRRSTVTYSCPDLLSSTRPPSSESHALDDSELQELNNIKQQVENYWAKFSPETTEGCETSCSSKVKAAFQAGRVLIPTTINVTQIKNIKNIKKIKQINHYEPGTSLHISHAEVVAPGAQIVVHHIRKATDEDEDESSSEDESATDNDSYVNM